MTLKEDILHLKSKGYTYNQIKHELDCSKGTISYYLGVGQKDKTSIRNARNRAINPLVVKVSVFKNRRQRGEAGELNEKIRGFHRCTDQGGYFNGDKDEKSFTVEDFKIKCGNTCYLTGRKLDLSNSSSYSIDHIIPRAEGGSNTLENAGLTDTTANKAKGKLSLDEFKQLCLDVVNHFKLK